MHDLKQRTREFQANRMRWFLVLNDLVGPPFFPSLPTATRVFGEIKHLLLWAVNVLVLS